MKSIVKMRLYDNEGVFIFKNLIFYMFEEVFEVISFFDVIVFVNVQQIFFLKLIFCYIKVFLYLEL